MVKSVRSAGISIGVTLGFLALLAIAAKKTNIGSFLQESLKGFGVNVGKGITAPFQGIVEGVTSGGQGLGEAAASLSEGFQKSVSATLGGGANVFSEFGKTGSANTQPKAEIPQLDINKFFSDSAIKNRINLITSQQSSNPKISSFGGFGSAITQETALEKAIAESKRKHPEFFK